MALPNLKWASVALQNENLLHQHCYMVTEGKIK